MSRKKSSRPAEKAGKKNLWHLYGLQALTPAKFIQVVNAVLLRRYTLIGEPRREETSKHRKR